tara:strand:+ start:785 stop:1576 length:792 start_codon:yes stop_codon:yes gene_type:complete
MNKIFTNIRRNLVITLFLGFAWFFLLIYLFEPLLHIFMNKEEDYIPDLQGMVVEDALRFLESKGFSSKVNYIDFEEGCKQNTVVSTYPPSPQKINKNRPIEINVFSERSNVQILNFIGLNIKEAKRLSKKNKLKLDINYYIDSSDSIGIISRQLPSAFSIEGGDVNYAPEGSLLSVWICGERPPDEFLVPDIIGKGLNEAKNDLKNKGFLIGDIYYIYNSDWLPNTVYNMSYMTAEGYRIEILEGTKYTVPIRVDITVTKDGD